MTTNKKAWKYVSVLAILVSVFTLLLPVVSYSPKGSASVGYNILGILDRSAFERNVLSEYTGAAFSNISFEAETAIVITLCVIGIAAIILALAGISIMSKQYESNKPFVLTICGIIGTAIPSLVLLVLYSISRNDFPGTLSLGAYIIITPVAMIIAYINVTGRHRLTQRELQIKREAEAYIRPAGDLPVKTWGGNQYYGR